MADFTAILSGADPTAADQARAYELQRQAEIQLLRPDRGIFSGLANVFAGANLSRVPDIVGSIAERNVAAQPDLAAALSQDDPLAYAAQHPGLDPIAKAQLLRGGPAQAVAMKNALSEAALRQAQAEFTRSRMTPTPNPFSPGTSGAAGGAGTGTTGAPPTGALPTSGRYQPPAPTAGAVLEPEQVPEGKMASYIATLTNPVQRRAFEQKLRGYLARRQQPPVPAPAAPPG